MVYKSAPNFPNIQGEGETEAAALEDLTARLEAILAATVDAVNRLEEKSENNERS